MPLTAIPARCEGIALFCRFGCNQSGKLMDRAGYSNSFCLCSRSASSIERCWWGVTHLAGPTLNRVMPRLRCYFHRPDAPSLVRDTIRARFAVGNFHLRSVLKRGQPQTRTLLTRRWHNFWGQVTATLLRQFLALGARSVVPDF